MATRPSGVLSAAVFDEQQGNVIVGVAALTLAVAVIWVPALAPGLHGTSQMMAMARS